MNAKAHVILSTALCAVAALWLGLPQSADAQDAPIKIGVILPLSGPAAVIGNEDLSGIKYALDQVGGSVAGHKIDLVIADDQNSPNAALTEARRLIENEKVVAIVGSLNSSVALAIHPYTTRMKVPYLTGGIAAEITGARKSAYTFRASPSAGQYEPALAEWAVKHLGKSAILMGSDYAAGHDAVGAFERAVEHNGGKALKKIFPRQGETDYAPYFSELRNAQANFVYAYFFGGDVLRFVRQYRSFNLKLPLVMTNTALASGSVAQALGQSVDGIVSDEVWLWTLSDPETKKLVEGYSKKFGQVPQALAWLGDIQLRVMYNALKSLNGKVTSGLALAQAMEKVKFQAPGTLYRFDANHNPILDVHVVKWAWKDGKAVPNELESFHDIGRDGQPVH